MKCSKGCAREAVKFVTKPGSNVIWLACWMCAIPYKQPTGQQAKPLPKRSK